jgi:hypothetical protein
MTSAYGLRFHPLLKMWKLHDGTDFGAACGTPIRAPYAGVVTRAYFSPAYGNRLFLRHGSVSGVRVQTAFNHASRYLVRPGQRVSRGQVIGTVGSTGLSTGCHLHLMVWLDGRLSNPMSWLWLRFIAPLARRLYRRSPSASGTGVSLLKGWPQPFVRYVGVDLRRRQRCVTEHLLNTAQVGTALQEVGRHGMPQTVWPKVGRPRRHSERPMDDPSYDSRVNPLSAVADEDCRAGLISHELRPGCSEPGVDRAQGGRTKGNRSLFAALTEDPNDAAIPVKIIQVETT